VDTEEEKREVTSRALTLQVINQGSEAHEMNLVKLAKDKGQGFSNVALLGSKPPTPDESRACGRFGAVAPKRPHALLLFFWAGRGRGKRRLRSPGARGHKCLAFCTIKSVLLAKQRRWVCA